MRPLRNDLLLEAWDQGSGRNPLSRALTLLACASPERTVADLEALSIPARDLELLRIRRLTFGDTIRGFVACDSCGASLEFETQVSSLLDRLEPMLPSSTTTWQIEDWLCSMRPANSTDLAVAAERPGIREARQALLERCTTIRRTCAADDFPLTPELEQAAIGKFEEMHRAAEIVFTLTCAACQQNQQTELDIAQFFWAEVRAAALALLREVHELARAYGWAEAAILDMNGTRRRAYLEMARS